MQAHREQAPRSNLASASQGANALTVAAPAQPVPHRLAEEAWIGATPQTWAKAASEVIRSETPTATGRDAVGYHALDGSLRGHKLCRAVRGSAATCCGSPSAIGLPNRWGAVEL